MVSYSVSQHERSDMTELDSDEGPWTEAQWEGFIRRQEARADRFGELFETLREHPQRDSIIAREMGWEEEDDEMVEEKAAGFDAPDAAKEAAAESGWADDEEEDD